MSELYILQSDRLSGFKTDHKFLHFGTFASVAEFASLVNEANSIGIPVYILGNGSNTYFASRIIRSAVLKNNLPKEISIVADNKSGATICVSSSTPIMKVLRFCESNSLDSFYFLASVPGNIGGALAMNAGGGTGKPTILDYVEHILVWEDGVLCHIPKAKITAAHRHTPYSGCHSRLIVNAQFHFSRTHFHESPIKQRIRWHQEHQDTGGPSLGSVFKSGNGYVFGILKRLKFGCFGSYWSEKWGNWIVCKRGSLAGIRACILAACLLHLLVGRKIDLEIVKVK